MCILRVFWMYKLVADSGEVVIQKQGFSIVGTHEPAIAMPLSPFCLQIMESYSYKNQIFPVRRHQGVRQFVSPGLHHIKSASSHCGTLHKKDIRRLGSLRFSLVWRQLFSISKTSKR